MKLLFAPLQGYTDAVYRSVHSKHFKGVDLYYTPFCRLEKGEMRKHDKKDVSPADFNASLVEDQRLVPQVIGNSKNEVAPLLDALIEMGHNQIDLNFGCPFPMIAKKSKGAGILQHSQMVAEVLSLLKDYPSCRFSVKMRLGMEEPTEALSLLPLLNEASLVRIVMHARTGKQQYSGELDWEHFEEFYKACQLPIVFNGDLNDVESVQQVMQRFPNLEGVMMGRGLLSRPFLAEEIAEGRVIEGRELVDRMQHFMEDLEASYSEVLTGGEHQIVQKLTSYWEYLLPDIEKRLRKRVVKSNKLVDYNSNVVQAIRSLR